MVDVFDGEHGHRRQSIIATESTKDRKIYSPSLSFHEKAQHNKKRSNAFFRGFLCRWLEKRPV